MCYSKLKKPPKILNYNLEAKIILFNREVGTNMESAYLK